MKTEENGKSMWIVPLIIELLEMELHKMGARNIEDRANSNNARKGNKSKYAQQQTGMFFYVFFLGS